MFGWQTADRMFDQALNFQLEQAVKKPAAKAKGSKRVASQPTPPGTIQRPSADGTRERILDAAERVFAYKGYDGTTLRDVAAEADVQLANIAHHFGPKESLFEKVIERRATTMGELRLNALHRYRRDAGDGPIPLELLIEGYVWPFIERSSRHGEGWKSYAQLVARLANSFRWGPIISKNYDSVAEQYIHELNTTLPHASAAAIYNCFHFMVGAMLVACAESGRIERLSKGNVHSRDLEGMFDDMLPFLKAGFLAIADSRHISSPPAH
jgi:AcrR family transcriptional regulator